MFKLKFPSFGSSAQQGILDRAATLAATYLRQHPDTSRITVAMLLPTREEARELMGRRAIFQATVREQMAESEHVLPGGLLLDFRTFSDVEPGDAERWLESLSQETRYRVVQELRRDRISMLIQESEAGHVHRPYWLILDRVGSPTLRLALGRVLEFGAGPTADLQLPVEGVSRRAGVLGWLGGGLPWLSAPRGVVVQRGGLSFQAPLPGIALEHGDVLVLGGKERFAVRLEALGSSVAVAPGGEELNVPLIGWDQPARVTFPDDRLLPGGDRIFLTPGRTYNVEVDGSVCSLEVVEGQSLTGRVGVPYEEALIYWKVDWKQVKQDIKRLQDGRQFTLIVPNRLQPDATEALGGRDDLQIVCATHLDGRGSPTALLASRLVTLEEKRGWVERCLVGPPEAELGETTLPEIATRMTGFETPAHGGWCIGWRVQFMDGRKPIEGSWPLRLGKTIFGRATGSGKERPDLVLDGPGGALTRSDVLEAGQGVISRREWTLEVDSDNVHLANHGRHSMNLQIPGSLYARRLGEEMVAIRSGSNWELHLNGRYVIHFWICET